MHETTSANIQRLIECGVKFADAHHVHIDDSVSIGSGSYIGCGVHITKGTVIGKHCIINQFVTLENTTIEDSVEILPYSYIKNSHISNNASIGPFAHISDGSYVGAHSAIGNFVEVKRSTIGQHTKAKHLTYLGDAQIGNHVNIGAGTITCNYNGIIKQKTIINDHASIGSNNSLVAPVTIGEGAYTAAGSTITTNVPENALAIARARQINKEEYAKKLKPATLQKTVLLEPIQDPKLNENS